MEVDSQVVVKLALVLLPFSSAAVGKLPLDLERSD